MLGAVVWNECRIGSLLRHDNMNLENISTKLFSTVV